MSYLPLARRRCKTKSRLLSAATDLADGHLCNADEARSCIIDLRRPQKQQVINQLALVAEQLICVAGIYFSANVYPQSHCTDFS